MNDAERKVKACDVRIGDRITSRGLELTVTRIDTGFMGADLLAFVEDTEVQWLKIPMSPDAEVVVRVRVSDAD